MPGLNLRGIIPPLVTPLLDRDSIDEAGTEKLIRHVLDGGVSALFVLGSTGEAPSLSYRLRRDFIRRVCHHVNGRVPVLVGVTDTAFVESVSLAECAAEAGADAVVLATPYYFPAGQTELTAYVEHIVEELPLPLVLYNMPSLTKVWFELSTLERLSELPGIVGVKDSSGDLHYFAQVVALKEKRPDWSVFIGPEHLTMEAGRIGGDGGVNGGANLFPELFFELDRAAREGDEERCSELAPIVQELQEIYQVGKYASRFIKATKCALSIMGICSDCMAEPFHRFLPPERERVRAILERLESQHALTFQRDRIDR